jgi:hypothetical protein
MYCGIQVDMEHTVDVGTNIHQTATLAKTETHLSTSIDYILPTGLTHGSTYVLRHPAGLTQTLLHLINLH